MAGVPSAEWGQAVAAYVAVAESAVRPAPRTLRRGPPADGMAPDAWGPGPENRAHCRRELLMLPNGKPDRLAMTARLNALHQGK